MATAFAVTLDGYTFPRADIPMRGPTVETSPQRWSQQDVLGAGTPGTILTFLGFKSQEWSYISHASTATKDKLVAVFEGRSEVTFTNPQNTTGFKVMMTELSVDHKEPIEDGKYLCRFTLVSRAPVSSDVPAEQEDDVPTIVRKTSDETLSNDNTLQDDDDLLIAVGANELWVGWVALNVNIKAASDFQCNLVPPSGSATIILQGGHADGISAGDDNFVRQFPATLGLVHSDSDQNVGVLLYFGTQIGGTGGNLQLKWAPINAVAESTTVRTGSYLVAWKQ